MSAVDYWGVREAIKAAILGWTATENIYVHIEDEFLYSSEATPAVVIYLDSRDAVDEEQVIRAGQATRFMLRFTLYIHAYSLEGSAQAIKQRDETLAQVELALMNDRTLSLHDGTSKIIQGWLAGGEMFSGRTEEGEELASAEIQYVAAVNATTA
jgi:hypothetical protein